MISNSIQEVATSISSKYIPWTRDINQELQELERSKINLLLKRLCPKTPRVGLAATLSIDVRTTRANGWVVKEADKNLGLVLMSPDVYRTLLLS